MHTSKMASMSLGSDDLYKVLGVADTATTPEIKKAFRALAREFHPDIVGDDPAKLAQFHRIRAAYEVLVDPQHRQRYDMRGKRRTPGRMAGGFHFWSHDRPPESPKPGRDPMNDIGLDDLFNEGVGFEKFGFGGGKKRRRGGGATAENRGTWGGDPGSEKGRDIEVVVDVPRKVARRGGTVTLNYKRLVRSEDGRGVAEYDEIHDLRVPPATPMGERLRVPRQGHAGLSGGPYGDLVAEVRLVGPSSQAPPPREAGARVHEAPGGEPNELIVPISIQEALLGGPIAVDTPQGRVHLRLPSCTSGGSRFRLKGKGMPDQRGQAQDLLVRLRVVTPALLDEDSRELIEKFAELNPYDPRK